MTISSSWREARAGKHPGAVYHASARGLLAVLPFSIEMGKGPLLGGNHPG